MCLAFILSFGCLLYLYLPIFVYFTFIPRNFDIEATNYYLNNYETNLHPRFTAEFILESVEFIVKYQLPRQNTFKYPSKSSMYYFCSYISCSYYGLR